MNWLPAASDPVSFTSENFLASTADLASVLAVLASSSNTRSPRGRHAQRLGAAALCALLENSSVTSQLPMPAFAVPAAGLRREVAGTATCAPGRRIPAGDGPSHPQRRECCRCGQCKWCRDNVRWDRIFNERFDDPTYYSHPVIRHNSTLSRVP